MNIDLTTPALLFPAISLLLLAFTNRFLAIANLIRGLHGRYLEDHDKRILGQMKNLRSRLMLIRNMQALGISSLLLCVLCMFLLFAGEVQIGKIVFGTSLIMLIASLALSVVEIQISTKALKIQLSDLENLGGEGEDLVDKIKHPLKYMKRSFRKEEPIKKKQPSEPVKEEPPHDHPPM